MASTQNEDEIQPEEMVQRCHHRGWLRQGLSLCDHCRVWQLVGLDPGLYGVMAEPGGLILWSLRDLPNRWCICW